MKRAVSPAAGFAYIEVLVAVLLLALCALPAANAVRNGLNTATIAPARMKALRCMRDKMESVLAQPYANLLAAKNGISQTTYSEAAGNGCDRRWVFIDVYQGNTNTSNTGDITALLRVDVVSPDTGFSFTTLVSP